MAGRTVPATPPGSGEYRSVIGLASAPAPHDHPDSDPSRADRLQERTLDRLIERGLAHLSLFSRRVVSRQPP